MILFQRFFRLEEGKVFFEGGQVGEYWVLSFSFVEVQRSLGFVFIVWFYYQLLRFIEMIQGFQSFFRGYRFLFSLVVVRGYDNLCSLGFVFMGQVGRWFKFRYAFLVGVLYRQEGQLVYSYV